MAMPIPPTAAAAPAPLLEAAVDRPLTDTERAALSRVGRGAKALGAVSGFVALGLGVASLLGISLRPPIDLTVMFWTSIIGLAAGIRSRVSRTGSAFALAGGAVKEIRGVAGWSRDQGFFVRGPRLLVSSRRAPFRRDLPSGSEVTLSVAALEDPSARGPNGCVLAMNGNALQTPYPCRMRATGDVAPQRTSAFARRP